MTSLAVFTEHSDLHKRAKQLANHLDLPFCSTLAAYDFLLTLTPDGLSLQKNNEKTKPLYIDFLSGKLTYRTQHATTRNEILIRALGLKKQQHATIIDATAGLGRDSFLLASLGFSVIALERSPIVFSLLNDGIKRGQTDIDTAMILARITWLQTNAIDWLKKSAPVDYIYLDPMFPERKKSALVKKEMRFFHDIIGNDDDAELLLQTAFACATKRVVVKRPTLAGTLGNKQADFSLQGSSSRFDVYLRP
ncbi:hypothetical protein AYO45_06015 [Gammaproteobacteria bacterium SCGC AG-212-F23]|nr:hypothetical protein AYO45_06015 [Gammaproteobacteria bacterium SCGC AG-212-F23]